MRLGAARAPAGPPGSAALPDEWRRGSGAQPVAPMLETLLAPIRLVHLGLAEPALPRSGAARAEPSPPRSVAPVALLALARARPRLGRSEQTEAAALLAGVLLCVPFLVKWLGTPRRP